MSESGWVDEQGQDVPRETIESDLRDAVTEFLHKPNGVLLAQIDDLVSGMAADPEWISGVFLGAVLGMHGRGFADALRRIAGWDTECTCGQEWRGAAAKWAAGELAGAAEAQSVFLRRMTAPLN